MKNARLHEVKSEDLEDYICVWTKFNSKGTEGKALVDTGAGISIMPREIFDSIEQLKTKQLTEPDRKLSSATGSKIRCDGMTEVEFSVDDMKLSHKFYICNDDVMIILGRDFIRKYKVGIELSDNGIRINNKWVTTYDIKGSKIRNTVNIINTLTIKAGHEAQVSAKLKGKGNPDGMVCMVAFSRTLFARSGALVAHTCVRPGKKKCCVRILNATEQPITLYKNMTVGVLQPAEKLKHYEPSDEVNQVLDESGSESDVIPETLPLPKDSQRKFEIPAHVLESKEATRRYLKDLHREARDLKRRTETQHEAGDMPDHVRDLYERSIKEVPKEYHKRIHEIITKHAKGFAKSSTDMGRTTWVKHEVETGDHSPVRQRPRRLRHDQKEEMQKQIRALQENGLIRPSNSEWASNVVLVKKKDGTWRMCIDYRELNKKTLNPDTYMLPRIDDTLDALSRAKYFCTLDIMQGYHNVELAESAKPKTAFHAPFCNPSHWEYVYMPFGLVRAPRTFQRLMDRVLQGLDHKIALAYIDDIIVYGATVEEVLDNLDVVLARLTDSGVKLKAKKCFLFQKETTYLGHVISSQGVKCDPVKVEAVKAWHPPKTPKQVRSFLGMVCYYNKFIKNFAQVAMPLYDLIAKNKKWVWKHGQQDSFENLRNALTEAPILAYPERNGRYILDTDASNFACGAVLSQLQKDDKGELQERVIAYYSKTFNSSEQRYCARRRELLAIVKAIKHFDVYLRGPEFTIRTDHASLQYIKTLTNIPDQMFRWILFLEQYSYQIQVRAGKDHANADTLSRIPCNGKICICDKVEQYEQRAKNQVGAVHNLPEVSICAIKFLPKWDPEQIAKYQEADPDLKTVLQLKKNKQERPNYREYSGESPAAKAYMMEWLRLEVWNGVLYRRWENNSGSETRLQLVVPSALQRMMCREVHDGATTCHLGKKRVIRLLQKSMYWYKMDKDVAWWVRTCEICQRRMRPKNTAKAPMTVFKSGYPNERVAMDVVGPIKKSKNGNEYVLCMTDHFSKYSQAYAMPDQKAERVARIFVNEWVYRWGEPMSLHADQGSNFESNLLKQVCKLLKVDKTRTTPYHPQGNAQTERYNQTIINIVAKLTDKEEYTDWDEQLPVAVAAYNATEHATTKFTPNRLMIDREVRHNFDKMLPSAQDQEELETWEDYVQRMDRQSREAFQAARDEIGRSVLLQKKYYDKSSHLNKYKTGDAVLIRDHRHHMKGEGKLSDKYAGPYYVLDVLSDVNFRLSKSKDSEPKIIHHDRMKPFHQREKPKIDWVFEQSRTYNKERIKNSEGGGALTEVLDRMMQLEQMVKKQAKKNPRKKKTEGKEVSLKETAKPDQPAPPRKRGRPKKKNKAETQDVTNIRRSDRLKNKH